MFLLSKTGKFILDFRTVIFKIIMWTELQIRGGIEDISKIFFYFSMKTYVVIPH